MKVQISYLDSAINEHEVLFINVDDITTLTCDDLANAIGMFENNEKYQVMDTPINHCILVNNIIIFTFQYQNNALNETTTLTGFVYKQHN